MNDVIFIELEFFIISILWGGLIIVIYDSLRIIRNLIKHKQFVVAAQDIFYWILCGFLIFQMMYKHNNGIIRAFSIIGMLIGMIIYRYMFSDFLVESLSFLLMKIGDIFFSIFKVIVKPFIWMKCLLSKTIGKKVRQLFKKVKKVIYNQFKPLKNKIKSSKISLYGGEDGDLLEKEKKKEK